MAKDKESSRKERVPGRVARTLKSAWLGSRIGSSYLGGKITDAFRSGESRVSAATDRHLANAKRIAATMGELRGPLMKVGQLLSTHSDMLPSEYGGVLQKLQASAPPMTFETIRAVVEQDLGAPLSSIFTEFSREAVAAASLGQVHRARLLDGTEVAVKVQYPGADDSVRADLSNVSLATAMMKRLLVDALGQSRFDLTPFAEELAEHLLQETDYCREAYNAKLLGALFEGDREIVIPRVCDQASGLKVVAYEWIEGEPIDVALERGDPARRERVVRQLAHALWHQLFRGAVLHADPHPGNFKITPDGRLAILDHGCVKVFDEGFVRAFCDMIHATLTEDEARLRDVFVELELMEDRESDDEFEDMQKITQYFSVGTRSDEEFDFGAFDYLKSGRDLLAHFLTRGRPPPAQRHFMFLSRVLVGYYEYFARAEAKLNYHRLVMPYLEGGFTGRTIVVPPYGDP